MKKVWWLLTQEAQTEAPTRALFSFQGQVLESEIRDEGKIWEIVAIQEGWSKNGIYWTRECLEKALPLFDGAPVNVYQSDADGELVHLSAPARQAQGGQAEGLNNAGFTAKPRLKQLPGGRWGVACDYHCTHDQVRETALQAKTAGVPCPLGFSIDGFAIFGEGVAEGRRGLIAITLESLSETTVVTRPAAGGQFARLIAGEIKKENPKSMKLRKFLEARLRKCGLDHSMIAGYSSAQVAEAVAKIIQESEPSKAGVAKVAADFAEAGKEAEATQVLEPLVEEIEKAAQLQAQTALIVEPIAPAPSAADAALAATANTALAAVAESIGTLNARVDQLAANTQRDYCAQVLRNSLAASNLPEVAQGVLRKRFAGQVFESVQLAEAIEDQRKILAATVPDSGPVQESSRGGNLRTGVGTEPIDRARAAVMMMFDGQIPADVAESERGAYQDVLRGRRRTPTIRELYVLIHDDPEMSGRFGPNALVQENNRSMFPETVGVSMTKQLVKAYRNREQSWRKYVTINNNVTNYKEQTRILQGGIGQLPSVAEGSGRGVDTYVYGLLGREDKVRYSMGKRGLLIGLTRELVLDDDMDTLRNIPMKLGKAARYSVNKFVYGLQIGLASNTLNNVDAYTGFKIYNAAHNNVGADPYGFEAFVNMISRFKAQREYGGKWVLNDTITSGTTWTLESNVGIRVGMELLIKGEIVTVTAVNSNGTGITVTRPAPVNHADGEILYELLEEIEGEVYHFVIPKSKWATTREFFMSNEKPDTANNNANVLADLYKQGKIELHEVHEMYLNGSAANAYGHLDAGAGTGIEMAFLNGNEDPEITVADMPNVGTMLTADELVLKARHEFTGAVIDPQMMQANFHA